MPESHRFNAFVAFAGGGAKGIVHVGALKALEAEHVRVLGAAGTSAGAIIATLVASGYKADEILHPDGKRSVLDDLAEVDPKLRHPTDFFGGGWPFVWLFRTFNWILLPGFAGAAIIGAALPLLLLLGLRDHFDIQVQIARAWLIAVLIVVAAIIWLFSGLTQLARLNKALHGLLQRRLFPDEPSRIVRMRDFGPDADRPALKIVAANLSRRELRLFSAETTPHTAVADAVCASIALPMIFRTWRLGLSRYMDGGIVSNLPAWPFDEERELHPEALTLAFDINSALPKSNVNALNWLGAMLHTGFFGRAQLNLRAMRNAELFVLETELDVLDFDLSKKAALEELAEATKAASERLATRLTKEPRLLQDASDGIHALVEETLGELETALTVDKGRVRVALAMQDPAYARSIRRRYHTNYDPTDPDCFGLIELTEGPLREAWTSYEPELELEARGDLALERSGSTVHPAWPEVRWRLSVPIWDTGPLRAPREILIIVDGSAGLPLSEDVEVAMGLLAQNVTAFFRNVLYRTEGD